MTDELFDLARQVAVVTGGTGALGNAIACGLAQRGMRLAILGRDADKGEQVVSTIRSAGGEATFFTVDVTSGEACRRAALQVVEQFGRVDALVNAAGGNHPQATTAPDQSFFDLDPQAMEHVVRLNGMGTILPCQAFGRYFAQQRVGVILNIASMAAMRPLTRIVGYSAAKAAVTNFTQWLSVYMCQTVGPTVRVNAIAPGFFLTEQNRFLLLEKRPDPDGESERSISHSAHDGLTLRGREILNHTPMGRFGEPNDLLGAVVWLLSPASRFVTGAVIPVDGGFSAYAGV